MTFSPPPISGTTPPINSLPPVPSASGERERLIAWCEECKRLLREQEAQEKSDA